MRLGSAVNPDCLRGREVPLPRCRLARLHPEDWAVRSEWREERGLPVRDPRGMGARNPEHFFDRIDYEVFLDVLNAALVSADIALSVRNAAPESGAHVTRSSSES